MDWWKRDNVKHRNTSGTKIGVNPQTQFFSTPGGVYVYPVREMWDQIVNNKMPYAGGAPYIYVLEATGPVLDLAHYSAEDWSRDRAKLVRIINRIVEGNEAGMDAEELIQSWLSPKFRRAYDNVATPGGELWTVVKNAANLESTRRTGEKGAIAQFKTEKRLPWVWNGLLRALGYSAIVDRKGEKIIHPNEPVQAVFLKSNAFRTLDVVENPFSYEKQEKANRKARLKGEEPTE